MYKAVDIKGVEVVQSIEYRMAKSRVSYFVRVDYEGEGTYVARISKYLKVARASADGGVQVLRIAVADLYKTEIKQGYQGEVILVRGPERGPRKKDYPISVDHIAHKLLFADAASLSGRAEFRRPLWYFTAYSNTYVKRNPELE